MPQPIDIEEHAIAVQEHEAWKVVVAEWQRLRLPDFNGERVAPLVRAIELWGERLSALRSFATPEDQAKWLAEAATKYARSKG